MPFVLRRRKLFLSIAIASILLVSCIAGYFALSHHARNQRAISFLEFAQPIPVYGDGPSTTLMLASDEFVAKEIQFLRDLQSPTPGSLLRHYRDIGIREERPIDQTTSINSFLFASKIYFAENNDGSPLILIPRIGGLSENKYIIMTLDGVILDDGVLPAGNLIGKIESEGTHSERERLVFGNQPGLVELANADGEAFEDIVTTIVNGRLQLVDRIRRDPPKLDFTSNVESSSN